MIERQDKQDRKDTKRKREKCDWDWFLKKFDDGSYQDRVIVNQRKHDRRERRSRHS